MRKRFVHTVAMTLVVSTMAMSVVHAAPDANAIKEQKENAAAEVSSLQNQIAKVVTEINDLEDKLVAKGEEILVATDELAAAEEKEKEQYEAMKLRIKYMYEEGDNSILVKFLEAGSIAELLNQAEYVQKVHAYDREQLQEYVETKETIATLKTTLEEEQKELQASQAEFEKKKSDLNATLEAKKDEVADLEAEYQAALEQIAREEEEKRRQEELAQQQQQNNNRPSGNRPSGGSSSVSKPQYQGQGNTAVAQAIVSAAYSQLGVPYVWGGTSPGKGLDCSGLTQYCHRVAGISIPRTSGPQGSNGTKVTDPQPGDIVCYSGHVGIYIGGGQMIHAPEPGDVVKIQNVYGRPWYRRYW